MDTIYYIYSKPDGYPDISTHELNPAIFPGYTFHGTTTVRPDHLKDKRLVNGQWVWGGGDPEYMDRRRSEYPSIGDQLDALYKAMVAGTIPNVPAFRDPIDAVKAKYPKS